MWLHSLGYVGFKGQNLQQWQYFASEYIGLQVQDAARSSLSFRMDDRKQRVVVDSDGDAAQRFFGWEVADKATFEAFLNHLDAHEVAFSRGSAALAAQRQVTELVCVQDPLGNPLEVFYGAAVADTLFVPSRNISGFRTGTQGLGHIVLTVASIDAVKPFYEDILGFQLSDYALRPFRAYFFHTNTRHHSLAMVETGVNGVHHLMMELFSLDDVGQAYDLAQRDDLVGVTLGRHTNDFMTSFYFKSPAGVMIEYGWGGREIEPATWQPFECEYGPSLWGHERSWLTEEKKREARDLRIQAARDGHRELVQVMAGNHHTMQEVCPWWQAQWATSA